ncbi:MAG: 2-oxoglutarate dehydrogenase E1 subunit family protein, partial [Polyangiaceae bacterium]
MFDEFGINAGYVEELHTRWLQSPQSVEAGWREFFERPNGAPAGLQWPPAAKKNGATKGSGAVAYREAVRETVIVATELQSRVAQLVNAYRVRGHLFARLDPLENEPETHPELELSNFGLSDGDLDKTFSTAGMSGLPERATLRQIVRHLGETYCSSIGVEFTNIE